MKKINLFYVISVLITVLILVSVNIFAAALSRFSIKDELFAAVHKVQCKTDIVITSVEREEGKYTFTYIGEGDHNIVSIVNGQNVFWGYGARHIWKGKISFAGYVFESSNECPLQFKVTKDEGYVYIGGEGTVSTPDNQIIKLGDGTE